MRKLSTKKITKAIKQLCQDTCINIDANVQQALIDTIKQEDNPRTKFALDIMIKNADIAKKTQSPLCQDTGIVIVLVEIGQNLQIVDGCLEDAINKGVKQAYEENFFRKSVVDPITRKNTQTNTPAIIYYSIKQGDSLVLWVMPKGFGSENMSKTFMLTPADGVEGIKKVIMHTVEKAGGNPCPPIIVGVGIGGTMEKAALLSKQALLRDFHSRNPNSTLDKLEKEWLEEINTLNIGTQGLGGKTTALKVFIESFPTHIAGLPVAITIQCHAVRHKKIVL